MATAFGREVHELVVVVPGILGSTLEKDGKEFWGIDARRLVVNLATFGQRLKKALTIGADADPDDPKDGVEATCLIKDLTVIPGLLGMDFYGDLRKHLRADLELAAGQLVDYPYDWRSSSRVNGARLTEFLGRELEAYARRSGRTNPTAILVCHSMGGLVARWCVEKAGGGGLVSTLVTIGTPHKGSILALDPVVNGAKLPRRFGMDVTEMARSFPSLYELLPTYSCVSIHGGAPQRLAASTVLPRVTSLCPDGIGARITKGLEFHADLAQAVAVRTMPAHELICFRGAEQPTAVSADIGHDGLSPRQTMKTGSAAAATASCPTTRQCRRSGLRARRRGPPKGSIRRWPVVWDCVRSCESP
jgi:pimeloyl-ACP methyl ester carboxylesterase